MRNIQGRSTLWGWTDKCWGKGLFHQRKDGINRLSQNISK